MKYVDALPKILNGGRWYHTNKDEERRKAVEILKKHNVWRRYNGTNNTSIQSWI